MLLVSRKHHDTAGGMIQMRQTRLGIEVLSRGESKQVTKSRAKETTPLKTQAPIVIIVFLGAPSQYTRHTVSGGRVNQLRSGFTGIMFDCFCVQNIAPAVSKPVNLSGSLRTVTPNVNGPAKR